MAALVPLLDDLDIVSCHRITQKGVHHHRTAGQQTGANGCVILRAFKERLKRCRRIQSGNQPTGH
jgi:hypothetical protein